MLLTTTISGEVSIIHKLEIHRNLILLPIKNRLEIEVKDTANLFEIKILPAVSRWVKPEIGHPTQKNFLLDKKSILIFISVFIYTEVLNDRGN
jgi:hypothetical protein